MNRRVIAFIAPTKLLLDQQRGYIAGSCDAVVKACMSETMGSCGSWSRELDRVDVLVATPEIVQQALERRHLLVSQLPLVILDECHYVSGKTPMSVICELLKQGESQPRILGLTGTYAILSVVRESNLRISLADHL